MKNLCVFAPLLYLPRFGGIQSWYLSFFAFLAFSLMSGTSYLFNDLMDLDRDKWHPRKSTRPLASGKLSISAIKRAISILFVLILFVAAHLGIGFFLISLSYLSLQVSYSKCLKHIRLVESLCVAIGFVLRVAAGAVVVSSWPSYWLFVTTLLLALFLTVAKRRRELWSLGEEASNHRPVLGSYNLRDLDLALLCLAAGSVLSYERHANVLRVAQIDPAGALVFTLPLVVAGIGRYSYLVLGNARPGFSGNANEALADQSFRAIILLWTVMTGGILFLQ